MLKDIVRPSKAKPEMSKRTSLLLPLNAVVKAKIDGVEKLVIVQELERRLWEDRHVEVCDSTGFKQVVGIALIGRNFRISLEE